jgi:hypothetical protein
MARPLPSVRSARSIRSAAAQWPALLLAFVCWLMSGLSLAASTAAAPLEVFVRDGCPHCAAAEVYLRQLAQQQPELPIVVRRVDYDQRALDDLVRHSRLAGIWPPGVPAFVIQGRILVGFDSPEVTGPRLALLLDQRLPPHSEAVDSRIETGLLGTLSIERLGLPLFTLALGLLDGFNPCAMWVLLFLLSLLVHLRDRRRMALIAGTFVLASGVIYYLFMSAWLNLFRLIGLSEWLRWSLALLALLIGLINVRDATRAESHFTLSIPAAAKPGLYARMRMLLKAESLWPALLGSAALAVVVNAVELVCTAGFPAIYTAVLAQQPLSAWAHHGYLGLYILGYLIDDSLMVAVAVIALSSRRVTERTGRWLKFVSGLVMAMLGAVLLLRPEWLV